MFRQSHARNLEGIHIEGTNKEFRNQVESKGKVFVTLNELHMSISA